MVMRVICRLNTGSIKYLPGWAAGVAAIEWLADVSRCNQNLTFFLSNRSVSRKADI